MQEKHIYRYIIVCFPYFFLIDLVFDPQLPTCTVYTVYRSAHFILREKCQLFVNSSNTLSVLVSNFFILDLEIGPFRALSNRYIMIQLVSSSITMVILRTLMLCKQVHKQNKKVKNNQLKYFVINSCQNIFLRMDKLQFCIYII